MVGWFDQGPRLATGFNVLVSTLFGRHSDYRLLEALAAGGSDEIYDYTKAGDELRDELWASYSSPIPIRCGTSAWRARLTA